MLSAIGLVISNQWSVVRARLAAEAAGMLSAIDDRSFDFAQDDRAGLAKEAAGMLGARGLVVGNRDAGTCFAIARETLSMLAPHRQSHPDRQTQKQKVFGYSRQKLFVFV